MKKIKIVLATKNPGKIREIKKIFKGTGIKLLSLFDLKKKKIPKIIENGKTFRENAYKKAKIIAKWSNLPALADDSGLEIFSLRKLPGIKSARFAGPNASYRKLCEKVLKLLKGFPREKRKARFVCSAVLVFPDGKTITRTGYCYGYISEKMKGKNGFGYDPIFYYPPLKKNFAEISLSQKNQVSHRFRAFRKIILALRYY